MGSIRGAVAAAALAVPAMSALLWGAPPAAATTAPEPLACSALETPEVVALSTAYFSELLPLEDEVFLPTPEKDAFLDRGGQYCAWLAAASPLHIAYSPITAGDAAAEMARLEAAGLTRSETATGTGYELSDVPGFTLPEVWGSYLFADGYWYLVKSTSTGSGGTTVLPVDPAVVASIQEEVVTALGPSPTLSDGAEEEPGTVGTDGTDAESGPPADGDRRGDDAGRPFTAAEPSVLSGLATAGEVLSDLPQILRSLGGALVLTALVAVPTALLNSSLQEGYGRLRDGVRRLLARIPMLRRRLGSVESGAVDSGAADSTAPDSRLRETVAIAIGVPLAAVIAVFVDPRVGWNGGTARLLASTLTGFVIESLALLALLAWILRRRGAAAHVSLRPGSLLILALAVLATRLSGFEPGFVFGVVLAVVFRRPPTPELETRAARTELVLLAALTAVSWFTYSALYPLAESGAVPALMTAELLASLTVGGLTALLVLILPAGNNPGVAVFRATRLRWAAALLGAVAAFCIIVVPMPESWEGVGTPLVLWVGLFVAYAVLAVAVWAAVFFTRTREPAENS